MFFPFLDYTTIDFDEDAGTNTIYTTTFNRSMVVIEFTNLDLQANEAVIVYANHLTNSYYLFKFVGSTLGGDDIPYAGTMIFPSGTPIRISSTNENNIQGKLHVFSLPISA